MRNDHKVVRFRPTRAGIAVATTVPDPRYRTAWAAHQQVLAIGHLIESHHAALAELVMRGRAARHVSATHQEETIREYQRELSRARMRIDSLDASLQDLLSALAASRD